MRVWRLSSSSSAIEYALNEEGSFSSLPTFFENLKRQPAWNNSLSLIRISHEVRKQLARYLEETTFKPDQITPQAYLQVLDYPLHHLTPQFGFSGGTIADPYKELGKRLTVDLRNLPFAKNSARLYCEASRERKNLTLIVGALHAEAAESASSRSKSRTSRSNC